MKRILFAAGVIAVVIGAAALAFSALQRYGYYHLLDGEAEMYIRMHGRMILSFVIGTALVAIGTICLVVRAKM